MSHSIYLETSIAELKPRVLDFLSSIARKAYQNKDYAITMQRKEMAHLVGKDTRTISRYLRELEDKGFIETKGKKGRGGTTLVLFNADKVKFRTSDKAILTSEKEETIEEAMKRKVPNKKVKPKRNKRNRRTKQQMVEARILKNEKQVEIDRLNDRLEELGGIPNWELFKETDDPIGNYRTYLLTRLYNRYAVLFSDRNNAEEAVHQDGRKVPNVSSDYETLMTERFFGTTRWEFFGRVKDFCEENNIDPIVYISAQFSRTIFMASVRGSKHALPYVNTMLTDEAYKNYQNYVTYRKKRSNTYASYRIIPPQFIGDYVVSAIDESYKQTGEGKGILELKAPIKDFLEGRGATKTEDALLAFYRLTDKDMKNKGVSRESRSTIKEFIIMQSLILTGGNRKVPKSVILGSESTRAMLKSIGNPSLTTQEENVLKQKALGALVHPYKTAKEQEKEGAKYLYESTALHETHEVINLIMERKGLFLSMQDIHKAFQEYGMDRVPVDDLSLLDINQIKSRMYEMVIKEEKKDDIDIEKITDKQDWVLEGSVVKEGDPISDAFDAFMDS